MPRSPTLLPRRLFGEPAMLELPRWAPFPKFVANYVHFQQEIGGSFRLYVTSGGDFASASKWPPPF